MEVALEEDHTEKVEEVNLLSIVRVVNRASQSLDDWFNDKVCDFLNELLILID